MIQNCFQQNQEYCIRVNQEYKNFYKYFSTTLHFFTVICFFECFYLSMKGLQQSVSFHCKYICGQNHTNIIMNTKNFYQSFFYTVSYNSRPGLLYDFFFKKPKTLNSFSYFSFRLEIKNDLFQSLYGF